MSSRATAIGEHAVDHRAQLARPLPPQGEARYHLTVDLHGMASCAEWTGIKLSTLLDEAGVDPKAKWFIAEGADAPHLTRSVPLKKARDDALIALYQNGERLMPANGYPLRLLLPGYEGMNVKYLRRIKLVEEPAMSFWADGGRSWAEAALQEPVLSKAFTRFRMPWRWDGGAAILQSRAWDEAGNVQPTRAEFVAKRGELKAVPPAMAFPNQHFNAVTSWAVDSAGEVKHVYA